MMMANDGGSSQLEMASPELLKCPFCHGHDLSGPMHQVVDAISWVGTVTCNHCDLKVTTAFPQDSAEKAIWDVARRWNSRPVQVLLRSEDISEEDVKRIRNAIAMAKGPGVFQNLIAPPVVEKVDVVEAVARLSEALKDAERFDSVGCMVKCADLSAAIAALQSHPADHTVGVTDMVPAEPVMIRAKDGSIVPLVIPEIVEPAGEEPVVWVSPDQLAQHVDPEPTDKYREEAGRYLPMRKTRSGQFTMPLYARPATPSNPDLLVEGPWHVVAVTMTQDKRSAINILTYMNAYACATSDEAVGKAVADALKKNPEHQVFSTLARRVGIDPAQDGGEGE